MSAVRPGAVALVLCLTAADQELAFAPAQGSKLEREFSSRFEMEMKGMECELNGSPVPAEYLPAIEMHVTETERVRVQDEFVELAAGRPRVLRRTYAELGSQSRFQLDIEQHGVHVDEEQPGASALEGETVVFRWNEGDGEYERTFEDGDGPAGLLAELEEDMDLRAILPGRAVGPGDEWELDAKALPMLALPGGDLAIEREGADPEDEERNRGLAENLSGTWTLRFEGTREEEGARLAVVAITGRLSSRHERQTVLRNVPVATGDATETNEMTIEAAGEILWDLAHGTASSMKVAADIAIEGRTERIRPEGDTGPSYVQTVEFTGRCTVELRTAVPQ